MATTSNPQMPILGGETDLAKYYQVPEKPKPVWEAVADWTTRLKIPEGWLYKVKSQYGDEIAVTFVPEK